MVLLQHTFVTDIHFTCTKSYALKVVLYSQSVATFLKASLIAPDYVHVFGTKTN